MNTRYDFILTNNTKLVNKNKNLFFLKKTYNFDINNKSINNDDIIINAFKYVSFSELTNQNLSGNYDFYKT